MIDSIGHAHAVGRGGDASEFQYRFRREVDFASAACMLVPADLFLDLGGFDEIYAPGYYEDTDLCFRLHERGLRTIYEPRSRVVHVQHGSSDPEQRAAADGEPPRRLRRALGRAARQAAAPGRGRAGAAPDARRPRRGRARADPRDRRPRALHRPRLGRPADGAPARRARRAVAVGPDHLPRRERARRGALRRAAAPPGDRGRLPAWSTGAAGSRSAASTTAS